MLQDEPTPVPPCPDMNGDLFLLKEMLSTLVKAVIIEHLEHKQYNTCKSAQWSSDILDSCLQSAKFQLDLMLQVNYKLIGSCLIMSRAGQRLHRSCTELWHKQDEDKEGTEAADVAASVKWENDSVTCLVSLYKVN